MSLFAHYNMNDNAASSTVLDNYGYYNGTYYAGAGTQNTSTGSTAGKIDNCLAVDGVNEYIRVADNDVFSPILKPFSISAWVNMTDATNFFIANKYSGVLREWYLGTGAAGALSFVVFDETQDKYILRSYNSALTSYEGSWIHIVATYDGGTADTSMKLYLNGARVDDASNGSGNFVTLRNIATPVDFGHRDGAFSEGKIDSIMIFDHELTLVEVESLYNNSSGTENNSDIDSKIVGRRCETTNTPTRMRY